MSAYFDNMKNVGRFVKCVANLSAPWFTIGKTYPVTINGLTDDNGNVVAHPSARFEKV